MISFIGKGKSDEKECTSFLEDYNLSARQKLYEY